MKKKNTIVMGCLFVLMIIGAIALSAHISSESYRKNQTSQGASVAGEIDTPNIADMVDEENAQLAKTEIIENIEAIANGPYGSIQLEVPDTWEFEICDVDNERLFMSPYGIILKPIGETEGSVEVGYCDDFGVCGTGLTTKRITLANNEAHIGYFNGNNNWNYISWGTLGGNLKNIIVLCNADWGEAYLDELLDILDTIRFDINN